MIDAFREALIAALIALAVWLMELGEPAPSPARGPGERYTVFGVEHVDLPDFHARLEKFKRGDAS